MQRRHPRALRLRARQGLNYAGRSLLKSNQQRRRPLRKVDRVRPRRQASLAYQQFRHLGVSRGRCVHEGAVAGRGRHLCLFAQQDLGASDAVVVGGVHERGAAAFVQGLRVRAEILGNRKVVVAVCRREPACVFLHFGVGNCEYFSNSVNSRYIAQKYIHLASASLGDAKLFAVLPVC